MESCAFNVCMENALKTAIEKAGGATKLAKALGGITSQAISQWDVCPVGRVLAVEGATGVSRHDLRPDIYGEASTAPPHQSFMAEAS